MRPLDNKTTASDIAIGRLKNHWDVARNLELPHDSMTFADYVKVEKIMGAWYNAGKLQATGHGKNTVGNPGDELSHQCKTIDFTHDDYVAYA